MAAEAGKTSASDVRPRTVLDPTAQRLAKVYAEALLARVKDPARCEQIIGEFEQVLTLMEQVEGFEALYTANVVGRGELRDLVRRAFAGRCSDPVWAFLCLLASRGKGQLLRPTVARLRQIRDERRGVVEAVVTTAIALDAATRDRVREHLSESLHAVVKLQLRVDPRVMGGMVVQVGEWVYDASTAGKYRTLTRRIRESLAKNSPGRVLPAPARERDDPV